MDVLSISEGPSFLWSFFILFSPENPKVGPPLLIRKIPKTFPPLLAEGEMNSVMRSTKKTSLKVRSLTVFVKGGVWSSSLRHCPSYSMKMRRGLFGSETLSWWEGRCHSKEPNPDAVISDRTLVPRGKLILNLGFSFSLWAQQSWEAEISR